ncbi:MAG TPA: hypothetical protein VFN67_28950 [Polyangiales bacterium]|nr:hypothetical protein [Polyangiales bacterium]
MSIEAASFFIAALGPGGIFVPGDEHAGVRVGEALIGLILAFGVIMSWVSERDARGIAFGTQAFAFFGAVGGLLLIAVGLGARGVPGLTFLAMVLLLLSLGLVFAARAP